MSPREVAPLILVKKNMAIVREFATAADASQTQSPAATADQIPAGKQTPAPAPRALSALSIGLPKLTELKMAGEFKMAPGPLTHLVYRRDDSNVSFFDRGQDLANCFVVSVAAYFRTKAVAGRRFEF